MGRSIIFTLGGLVVASMAGGLAAQQVAPKSSLAPANLWMKIPTADSARGEGVTESVRADRDKVFDKALGGGPLTPETADRAVLFDGAFRHGDAEIPKLPNRAILTATFVSYRSILTSSKRAIYTEVTFRAHRIFQDESGHAMPDGNITVCLPGGTVTTPSGEVISYLTQPRELSLQPGKTYLLVTGYRAIGDYYVNPASWDISDGVVRPNDVVGKLRLREGQSSLSGLTTDELEASLNRLLAQEKASDRGRADQ